MSAAPLGRGAQGHGAGAQGGRHLGGGKQDLEVARRSRVVIGPPPIARERGPRQEPGPKPGGADEAVLDPEERHPGAPGLVRVHVYVTD